MTAKIRFEDRSFGVRKLVGLAGGFKPLADRLGLNPTSVFGWVRVPTKHVIKIEEEFSGQITREEMRPDLFVRDGGNDR